MAKDYKIPFQHYAFDKTTHMMEYVGWYPPESEQVQWRDNSVFKTDLKIESSYRGRSAARVRVKDLSNGEIYSLGFSAFVDACQMFKVNKGKITGGTWTFRKQGSNYGLVPVEEKSKKTA